MTAKELIAAGIKPLEPKKDVFFDNGAQLWCFIWRGGFDTVTGWCDTKEEAEAALKARMEV